MLRDYARDIFNESDKYKSSSVVLGGWIRNIRSGKDFSFIDLNDGSCFKCIQIIAEKSKLENLQISLKTETDRISTLERETEKVNGVIESTNAANENMMKYEAYKGKWRGIAVGPTSDPTIGFTFGATGLLASANPYVSAAAFSLQGCSETLTACGYQLLGDNSRCNELEKEKQALEESV